MTDLITIEWAMAFAIGGLSGLLTVLAVVPAVHARAVRLTERHLQDSIPLSIREVRAQNDGVRARFAASICDLNRALDDARTRRVAQTREIQSQAKLIASQEAKLREMSATLVRLKEHEAACTVREKDLLEEVLTLRAECRRRSGALPDALRWTPSPRRSEHRPRSTSVAA